MTNEQVSDWNVSALIYLSTKSSWVGVSLRLSDSPEAEVRASEEILLLLGLLLWSLRLWLVSGSGLALLWLILIFVLEVGFRLWEAISHTWCRSSAGWPTIPSWTSWISWTSAWWWRSAASEAEIITLTVSFRLASVPTLLRLLLVRIMWVGFAVWRLLRSTVGLGLIAASILLAIASWLLSLLLSWILSCLLGRRSLIRISVTWSSSGLLLLLVLRSMIGRTITCRRCRLLLLLIMVWMCISLLLSVTITSLRWVVLLLLSLLSMGSLTIIWITVPLLIILLCVRTSSGILRSLGLLYWSLRIEVPWIISWIFPGFFWLLRLWRLVTTILLLLLMAVLLSIRLLILSLLVSIIAILALWLLVLSQMSLILSLIWVFKPVRYITMKTIWFWLLFMLGVQLVFVASMNQLISVFESILKVFNLLGIMRLERFVLIKDIDLRFLWLLFSPWMRFLLWDWLWLLRIEMNTET